MLQALLERCKTLAQQGQRMEWSVYAAAKLRHTQLVTSIVQAVHAHHVQHAFVLDCHDVLWGLASIPYNERLRTVVEDYTSRLKGLLAVRAEDTLAVLRGESAFDDEDETWKAFDAMPIAAGPPVADHARAHHAQDASATHAGSSTTQAGARHAGHDRTHSRGDGNSNALQTPAHAAEHANAGMQARTLAAAWATEAEQQATSELVQRKQYMLPQLCWSQAALRRAGYPVGCSVVSWVVLHIECAPTMCDHALARLLACHTVQLQWATLPSHRCRSTYVTSPPPDAQRACAERGNRLRRACADRMGTERTSHL